MLMPTDLILIRLLPVPRDLEIAGLLGWCRVPFRTTPKVAVMDHVAFYRSSTFGDRRGQIEYTAVVKGPGPVTSGEQPREESDYPSNQIHHSALSVEVNMAEGCALGTVSNYLRHLNISVGSLAEIENDIETTHDWKYLSDLVYQNIALKARDVGCLLSCLKKSIENYPRKKPSPSEPS